MQTSVHFPVIVNRIRNQILCFMAEIRYLPEQWSLYFDVLITCKQNGYAFRFSFIAFRFSFNDIQMRRNIEF